MLKELDDYDWAEAFAYCGEPGHSNGPDEPRAAIPDDWISTAPFTREDVTRIIAMDEGVADESEWVGVFELRDGRFACVVAGCDYTGWD